MKKWVFPTNVNKFRIHDWLAIHELIDFKQPLSLKVGDIVYLYCTLPEACINYKMTVERIHVPFNEVIDDTDYVLSPDQTNEKQKDSPFCRLRLTKCVKSDQLTLGYFRNLGCKTCFQSAQKVPDCILEHLEKLFV